jgi:hypothetical protein
MDPDQQPTKDGDVEMTGASQTANSADGTATGLSREMSVDIPDVIDKNASSASTKGRLSSQQHIYPSPAQG